MENDKLKMENDQKGASSLHAPRIFPFQFSVSVSVYTKSPAERRPLRGNAVIARRRQSRHCEPQSGEAIQTEKPIPRVSCSIPRGGAYSHSIVAGGLEEMS
ncbi:MAG: hypothetical protein LBT00_14595 [Spirochaetaceae bacterium]|nr:hypothetical protein [Spirochaetaceae bacterium]